MGFSKQGVAEGKTLNIVAAPTPPAVCKVCQKSGCVHQQPQTAESK